MFRRYWLWVTISPRRVIWNKNEILSTFRTSVLNHVNQSGIQQRLFTNLPCSRVIVLHIWLSVTFGIGELPSILINELTKTEKFFKKLHKTLFWHATVSPPVSVTPLQTWTVVWRVA
jgi:hypothetical protein